VLSLISGNNFDVLEDPCSVCLWLLVWQRYPKCTFALSVEVFGVGWKGQKRKHLLDMGPLLLLREN
jgi:tRNA(Arg) A34 adenosine deaminase TadA